MTAPSNTPFLTLSGFEELWDGPTLTATQQAMVTLLLGVASNWIYNQLPATSPDNPTAQFVVYDVVSNTLRYQKYGKLSQYSRTVGHRSESGAFDDPMKALEFTPVHKQLLGISQSTPPMSSCVPNDFDANDSNAGWPTTWSAQYGFQQNNFWEYSGGGD